jgi:N-methylhydantoinase B
MNDDARATNAADLDPFSAEILRNYLLSTVKEMVSTTVRTAYSTCFSEGEDFTCGLFDRDGNMIAQAAGINVHAGGLTLPVRHFLEKFGHFEPGDVIIHNDPYTGATHQGDGAIFRPAWSTWSEVTSDNHTRGPAHRERAGRYRQTTAPARRLI